MPTATKHTLGTFCWPECATPDAAATKAFYSKLLGWTWRDVPMGEQGMYHIAEMKSCEVAAMYATEGAMAGVPPHWASYVSVANADEAAAKAVSLGGKLMMGPFDVMEHGRMAVLQDPSGATFCAWQVKQHAGVGLLGETGAIGWTQLNTPEPEKAKAFYPALLGWTHHDMAAPDGSSYTTWLKADGPAGGMMPMPPGVNAPAHWLVYWMVEDTHAAHAKADALGAKTLVPVTDVPGMVRFTVMQDPQGAVFALMNPLM